jgi:ribosomal protein S6
MKTKNFQEYLETRFSQEEIAEIEVQAKLEVAILRFLQAQTQPKKNTL